MPPNFIAPKPQQYFNTTTLSLEESPHNQQSLPKLIMHPITLKFEDLEYKVKLNQKEKTILNGITGVVCPGEILAMLGPSGSGKTTLLTALGGRLAGKLSGKVTYNNQSFSGLIKRRTGFVAQDDVLYPHLTVTETLVFTALLRLPQTLTRDEKVEHVERVITELGLSNCRSSMIGGPLLRGISGGEKRRVSIGQEMLINPSLLLLDEPTSGLDSTTALRILNTIKKLASGGRTVVTTIHQPSSRLYYMFDKVVLLSEGCPIYYGPASTALEYFSSVGFSSCVTVNPADLLLDLANGIGPDSKHVTEQSEALEIERKTVRETLISAYDKNLSARLKAEVCSMGESNLDACTRNQIKPEQWCTSWWYQFTVLLQRGVKERRHEAFNKLRIFQVVSVAFLAGLLWWHTPKSHLEDRIALLFFFAVFWGFYPLYNAVFTFPQERRMLIKERSSGMYRLSSYFLARTIGDLPLDKTTSTLNLTMEEHSVGPLVPAVVKPEPSKNFSTDTTAAGDVSPVPTMSDLDKDFLCPICMQIIKDAFLTACGHSFCYMCIITHLRNKSDCPCCGHYLTNSNLFPNFLLDKLLKKTSDRQISKTASPVEHFRQAVQKGCEVTMKELDTLLLLLTEKKRKMEQEEAERNMQILLDFLHCLRKQKVDELKEVQTDLQFIKEDIGAVEKHRMDLYRARDRYSVKLRMLDDSGGRKSRHSSMDLNSSGLASSPLNLRGGLSSGSHTKKNDGKSQISSHGHGIQRRDPITGSDSQYINQSGLALVRKKRVHTQFNDLQECYLQKRRQAADKPHGQQERDTNFISREGYSCGLDDFQSVLTTFTRYSRLRVIAEIRHGDIFHSANIVSSIEFDRDDDLFATAGVSRRIKVFDFSAVVNEPTDAHCPVVEMTTRSKLSCLSWNKYAKNQIASSDYEGIVTVWDVTTRKSLMEYEEHEKRAWSVDFSRTDPSMLVSGSDDCKVKVWCTNQEASVLNIDMKANICCVKYNPGSGNYIAVGSADHHIHYYDLRNISRPVHVFTGHKKAVSYVKFLSNDELASASTDSTLRLWDVKQNLPVRTFRGHANEKNFVGLTVSSEYIACGSETNEVFVYHKEISKPLTWHRFGTLDMEDAEDEAGSYFISAVCWKSDRPTILTANSQGTIKVLVLAA